jgi:antitoxin Phd
MTPLMMGISEAKAKLSQVVEEVSRTGRPVTILKNNKPQVTISPITAADKTQFSQSSYGVFKKYANPEMIPFEKEAWPKAAVEKHAAR